MTPLESKAGRRKQLSEIFDEAGDGILLTPSQKLQFHTEGNVMTARMQGYTMLEICSHIKVSVPALKKWLREKDERTRAWDSATEALAEQLAFSTLADIENDTTLDNLLAVEYEENDVVKSNFNLNKATSVAKLQADRLKTKLRTKQELSKQLMGTRDDSGDKDVVAGIVINGLNVQLPKDN